MDKYYWYEGKKVSLKTSPARSAVRFSGKPSDGARRAAAGEIGALSPELGGLDLGNGVVLFETSPQSRGKASANLPAGSVQLPVLEAEDATPMVLTEEFIAEFKPEVSRKQINQLNGASRVRIVIEPPVGQNTFVLAVSEESDADAMTMANRYHDSGLTTYAHPNFVRVMKRFDVASNSIFLQQWALLNTGQGGGVAGQDIRAVPAWNITGGSGNITIAIIDEGVDYAHPDLNVAGKLVTGYDAIRRMDDPSPEGDDAHGTACAGIAAAASNGTGMRGVAPNCRIMGIRIAYSVGSSWVTTDAKIADGINVAVARGADVLSNSWGGGAPSDAITRAIRNARIAGRGGKGCIVCFAAGNDNRAVSYPGTLSEVITVAACNEWGERKSPTSRDGETWWGSNFGPEVDVCAPGVHIATTDISGPRGYNPSGDYTMTFNGTSAATPHVAGVAALCLSINPDMAANEVEHIIRGSTDDLGSAGYDTFTGHGRINAETAVRRSSHGWVSLLAGGGIGGYDLLSERDRVIAFDYAGTGRLDHLLLYRPGSGVVFILAKVGNIFTRVYEGRAGMGGYDLLSERDQIIAFDYAGTGRLDHLVLYRPGSGVVFILAKVGNIFTRVYEGRAGMGGYDLLSERDRIIAFDYAGTGRLDHLLLYRPGSGVVSILTKVGNIFTQVYEGQTGIGGYDLLSERDQIMAFDYAGTGRLDHLLLYRPGAGIVHVVGKKWEAFQPVYVGHYGLRNGQDRIVAFDYAGTGRSDHLLLYRPGSGVVFILANVGGTFAQVYAGRDGIDRYDLLSERDRIIAFDYAGTGRLDHLLLYRPGTGGVRIVRKA